LFFFLLSYFSLFFSVNLFQDMTRMGGMGAVGCEPHGQGWERWEWLVGGVGVGAVGGTRRNSEGLGGVNN